MKFNELFWRRSISLLITVCLLLGFIQTGMGTPAPGGEFPVYTYDFIEGLAHWTSVREVDGSSTFWSFAGSDGTYDSYPNDERLKVSKGEFSYVSNSLMAYGLPRWFALRFEIEEAGIYQASLKHAQLNFYTAVTDNSVYLVPASVTDQEQWTNAAYKIGDVSYYTDTVDTSVYKWNVVTQLGEIEIPEAGEYIIVFKTNPANPEAYINQFPRALILDPNSPTIASATLNIDKTKLSVGETAQCTPGGTMTNGIPADMADASSISYTSSAPGIASVDATTGAIEALAPGKTTIKVSVTLGGVTVNAEAGVTVVNGEQESLRSGEIRFYDFRKKTGDASASVRTYTQYTETRKWAYVADTLVSAENTVLSTYMQLVTGHQNWVALKVDVPAFGTYSAALDYYGYTGGGILGMYIAPLTPESAANPSAYMTGEYLVASQDTYNSSAGYYKAELSDITFENQGEYLLMLRAEGKNDAAWGSNLVLVGLTLDGTALENAELVLTDMKLGFNEGSSASVSAQFASGNSATLSTDEVWYESSAPDIAAVTSDGKINTAATEGSVDITVFVKVDDTTVSDTKTLLVSDDYTIEQISLSGVSVITPGTSGQLMPEGIQKNGEKIQSPMEVEGVSIIQITPEGAVTVTSEGLVNGISVGTAQIKATVLCRGKLIESVEKTINVVQHKAATSILEYVFTGSGADVRSFLDYGSRGWGYVEDTFSAGNTAMVQAGICLQIVSKQGEWIALKLQIPEAGEYKSVLEHWGVTGGGYADIYFLPMSAQILQNIGYYLGELYHIGRINGYAPGNGSVLTSELESVYVTQPGEYLLVLRSAGATSNSWAPYMYPREFKLIGSGALSTMELELIDDSTEIGIGDSKQLVCRSFSADGVELNAEEQGLIVTYISADPSIAAVDSDGIITANDIGDVDIRVVVKQGDIEIEKVIQITITDYSDILSVELNDSLAVWVRGTLQLQAYAKMSSGNTIPIPIDAMTYSIVSSEPEGCVTISESGLLTGIKPGQIAVTGVADFRGKIWQTPTFVVEVKSSQKSGPTIWTMEKRNAAQENIIEYSWAKEEADTVIELADRYVDEAERLWSMVVPEGLPRFYYVGDRYDPDNRTCRYCGADLFVKHSHYPFKTNPMNSPWKIQCPECKRRFPSNDFGSYYNSGLDEHGVFSPDLTDRTLLKNMLYPEKGEGWGVDDGFGYFPGHTYENGSVERHNYIAYYLHEGLWWGGSGNSGMLTEAITSLAKAYVYTGNAKYGRTGAILLDRIADFYPDYNWYQWHEFRTDNYRGKILDPVFECFNSKEYAKAYDAFYPIYDDPQVIAFLNEKATEFNLDNPKDSAAAIRENAESGILREIYRACVNGSIGGNFGLTQAALATAAVALDTMPETEDWLWWLMQPGAVINTGDPTNAERSGGNILHQLVNRVNRDGTGDEASPDYNTLWLTHLLDTAEIIGDYEGYAQADLYSNPKFVKMFTAHIPQTLASYYTAQIGDTGGTAGGGIVMKTNIKNSIVGFTRLKKPELAQLIYLLNDNTVDGIHTDITDQNPEQIQKDIIKVIRKYGEFSANSEMQTGYGFAVLRGGIKINSVGIDASINTLRDFWMYFGRGVGHGHHDALNLGIDAYGLNMSPDLGYPEQSGTGTEPNAVQWVRSVLSHNTVMVDGLDQTPISSNGTPLHFDDAGRVKVMDIEAPQVYDSTDIYRRTIVMVEASDDVSYGVDFFRIRGGNDHIYSFHSQSDEIYETEGLMLTPQVDSNGKYVGTYAGADVPWGPDPKTITTSAATSYLQYPPGFTWLDKVRRDMSPEAQFAVDFRVKDFRGILPSALDLHLRMTMLNNFTLNELALAEGTTPKPNHRWVEKLEYFLARRTGSNLDTLFTTVYEPYCDERYITGLSEVEIEVIEGTPAEEDAAKAVRVEHKNGRVDYVVYTTNNSILYRVDGLFNFRGFVGVYTLSTEGEPVYTYLQDGDIIGESENGIAAYTGKVIDFTRQLQLDNTITVMLDQEVDLEKLEGRYIYIDNSLSPENGVYCINRAYEGENGSVVLDIGDVTIIRGYRDSEDISAGYRFNIESNQAFRIPLSYVNDSSPVFVPIEKKTVDIHSELRFKISASSPIENELFYSATSLPRGASFDTETGSFRWTPETNQIGRHHVAIEASDGTLSTTQYIEIQVLGSTVGDSGGIAGTPSVDSSVSDSDNTGGINGGNGDSSIGNDTPSSEKFNDLTGFDWAKEAIYTLANEDIIKGVTENTYAPGQAIIRADFAILLVRMFGLEGGASENFTDVPKTAYYAAELAVAKQHGIVAGLGGNIFNPTWEISREDMMVMTARALEKADYPLDTTEGDILAKFSDASSLSEYARQASAMLVRAGFIAGADGKLKPKANATRAEVAVMLARVWNAVKEYK